jgi:alkanesulfonate monooxygenase SsuD/methylene tetrahydromethanopterin reductase-like flavin-dependent oxidoreductase (luciferase family)
MTTLGIVLGIRRHPDARLPLAEVYERYIGDAITAERLGFDRVWVNEHYFSEDDYCPAALPIIATIAARTTRVRLGTAVVCPPFHDPLRLALDVAVLDVLAGGRIDLGLGIGSRQEQEFAGMSAQQAWHRGWEAAAAIEQALSGDAIAFAGRFYTHGRFANPPVPIQRPVPIWWGGFGPQSMERAARRGYNVFGAASALYERALAAAGRDPSRQQVAQILYVHVSDSREQAWDEAQDGLHWLMRFHRERGDLPAGATPAGPLSELPPAAELRYIEALGLTPALSFIVGSPEEIAAGLLPFCRGDRGRVTELALTFRHPGMLTPQVHRSMELFRERVVPALIRDGAAFALAAST